MPYTGTGDTGTSFRKGGRTTGRSVDVAVRKTGPAMFGPGTDNTFLPIIGKAHLVTMASSPVFGRIVSIPCLISCVEPGGRLVFETREEKSVRYFSQIYFS